MMVDRLEAAAVHCLLLADALDRGTATGKQHVEAGDLLCHVSLCHPMRLHEDHVLAMAEAVRRGEVTAERLRAFVGDLRKGVAVMAQTGWCKTLGGGR